jgi:outer membrane immunogenic protein
LGFEADIQGSGERGSNTFVNPFSTRACTVASPPTCEEIGTINGTAATAYEAKVAWFGTVRGRIGVLVTDQVLLFGTGGLAYGQVNLSGNTSGSAVVINAELISFPLAPSGTAFSASKTNVGFAVGGGIEGKFSGWLPANWTWKLEYLYIDLGSLDAVTSLPAVVDPHGLTTPLTGPLTMRAHFTDNIVRVGLNYKFSYAPVVTK